MQKRKEFFLSWESRIDRAEHLANNDESVEDILKFYSALLREQKKIYDYLTSNVDLLPTGSFEEDLKSILGLMPEFLRAVESTGPPPLADEARNLLSATENDLTRILIKQWRNPNDTNFFAKAFIQPYAQRLAESNIQPEDKAISTRDVHCPFCGGAPQLSFLVNPDTGGDTGNRDLLCSICLSSWSFRRVVCANCNEENPEKIGYYQSPEYDHVRIEACDTCKHYLKGIDLTKSGHAIPLIDEVAAAPLDLWAQQHGYTKIELNLIGL